MSVYVVTYHQAQCDRPGCPWPGGTPTMILAKAEDEAIDHAARHERDDEWAAIGFGDSIPDALPPTL